MRIDHRQHVYYTLMLDGNIVGGNGNNNNKTPVRADILHDKSVQVDDHIDPQNRADVVIRPYNNCDNMGGGTPPLRGTRNPSPTTTTDNDIIHNNAYRKLVDAFCARYTGYDRNTLESALMQFLYRRKERGKTLTKAGLDALLHKLVTLAQNNIRNMIDIVYQSLNRGWLGFYPCTTTGGYGKMRDGKPVPYGARMAKYDTKYEDLDYLE